MTARAAALLLVVLACGDPHPSGPGRAHGLAPGAGGDAGPAATAVPVLPAGATDLAPYQLTLTAAVPAGAVLEPTLGAARAPRGVLVRSAALGTASYATAALYQLRPGAACDLAGAIAAAAGDPRDELIRREPDPTGYLLVWRRLDEMNHDEFALELCVDDLVLCQGSHLDDARAVDRIAALCRSVRRRP